METTNDDDGNGGRFNPQQWKFMAVLGLFREPVSVDIMALLQPLTPRDLLQVIQEGTQLRIIRQDTPGDICLHEVIPQALELKLASFSTREMMASLSRDLEARNLMADLPQAARVCLLARAGRYEDAARLEKELARLALDENRFSDALRHLGNSLQLCRDGARGDAARMLHLEVAVEFLSLNIILGNELQDAVDEIKSLEKSIAKKGDKRSSALLAYNLGMAVFLSGKLESAVEHMERGRQLAEGLADGDLVNLSPFYLGFYHYCRGELGKAVHCLEKVDAAASTSSVDLIVFLFAPIVLCSCLSYQNQFYQAIGHLEYHWLQAKEKKLDSLATTMRATLGIFLVRIDRHTEALGHLNASLQEARAINNAYGIFMAQSGLAYHHLRKGRHAEMRGILLSIFTSADLGHNQIRYMTPMHLEMVWALNQAPLAADDPLHFARYFDLALNSGSLHMKGSAIRLQAQIRVLRGEEGPEIIGMLEESEQLLIRSGDQYELAKTRAALGLAYLRSGRPDRARVLANQARIGLSGHGERYFPETLRSLIDIEDQSGEGGSGPGLFQEEITRALKEAWVPIGIEEGFSRIAAVMIRKLNAERGGVFYTENGNEADLELKVHHFLRQKKIGLTGFRNQLRAIQKCFQSNQIYRMRRELHSASDSPRAGSSQLYLPLRAGGAVRGVFYFENAHDKDCFNQLSEEHLQWLTDQLGLFCELMIAADKAVRERDYSVFRHSGGSLPHQPTEIIHDSRIMRELLVKSDRVAVSDSSVLITGETGVGKELLAQRLHQMSGRAEGPFVTFVPGSVPENLVESELFGHEKGAFTGADQRRIGLIELADKGTLFIDEISEFPLMVQVKLLRVIQERSFRRIGENRVRRSDFRLLAATNRDMGEEVSSGRFREDLLFRINTVNLHVPALRERKEDIRKLAVFFLDSFANKLRGVRSELTPDQLSDLEGYRWPGNVRELKNVIEQAVVLGSGQQQEINLPHRSDSRAVELFADMPSLDEIQRRYINFVLDKTKGRIYGPGGAARILGIPRTTLYNRMKRLGLKQARVK